MFPRQLSTLLLVVTAMLVPTLVQGAESNRVQVLGVWSEGDFTHAKLLTDALRRVVGNSSEWVLAPGDYSLEVLAAALGCNEPPDAQCQARIAQQLGVDRYVWGILQHSGSELVAFLHLWESGAQRSQARIGYSVNASEHALRKLAGDAFFRLTLPPTSPKQGVLVVTAAGKVEGELFVDGTSVGPIHAGYAEIVVPLGKHQVRLRAAGYPDVAREVEVLGKGPTDLLFQRRKHEVLSPGSEPPPKEVSYTGRTAAIIAMGGGAALIAGGVVFALHVDKIQKDPSFVRYRAGLRTDQNACTEADRGTVVVGAMESSEVSRTCSSAKTYRALEVAFLTTGAVASVAGVVTLLVTAPKKAPAGQAGAVDAMTARRPSGGKGVLNRLQSDLRLYPGGAELEVRVTF